MAVKKPSWPDKGTNWAQDNGTCDFPRANAVTMQILERLVARCNCFLAGYDFPEGFSPVIKSHPVDVRTRRHAIAVCQYSWEVRQPQTGLCYGSSPATSRYLILRTEGASGSITGLVWNKRLVSKGVLGAIQEPASRWQSV